MSSAGMQWPLRWFALAPLPVLGCMRMAPVLQAREWVLRAMLGLPSFAIPIMCAAVGVSMLRDKNRQAPARITIGVALSLLGIASFRHLALAKDVGGVSLEELPRLGGALGAAIAWPLRRLLSVWGAGIVVSGMTAVGVLVATKTPFSQVASRVEGCGRLAGVGLQQMVRLASRLTDGKRTASGAIPGEPLSDSPPPEAFAEEPALVSEPTDEPEVTAAPETQAVALPENPRGGYRVPPIDLLVTSAASEVSTKSIDETTAVLEATLVQFGVDARVTGYTAGPTVTRFEIELGPAVKVNRVVGLQNEIRYALASGDLRILAPIPGRSAIGIEVPNRDRRHVTLGDVLRTTSAKVKSHPLTVGLGMDISGAPILVNLAEMPHILIAGATGAGKSTCINAMLISLLARARPEQVRLILIDPKLVELSNYNGVPHLLTPVVTSPKKAAEALGWVTREMDARYEVLAAVGMRNSDLYNQAVREGALPDFDDGVPRSPFPYYVVVVDELADLMMVAPREVEDYICRIAQKARAVGIHLIVATQRPSVDVVTGVIKANIPSRLAFATASMQDSRVILDEGGADRLIGKGDMLYKHASASRPTRIQGAWVSEKEIEAVIGWCRRQRDVEYVEGVVSKGKDRVATGGEPADEDDQTLLTQAIELVVRSQLGSTSMLQRKLKVGFARAGRLMDLMETSGIVGPSQGSKPRDVLMTVAELDQQEASVLSEAGPSEC